MGIGSSGLVNPAGQKSTGVGYANGNAPKHILGYFRLGIWVNFELYLAQVYKCFCYVFYYTLSN